MTQHKAETARVNPLANTITEPNYPLNCWWVAARSEEVTRKPLGTWLLDRPVVLYRREDGSVAALDDRCPHRWAPLSKGQVSGDDITCPYHGFRFDGHSGRCVHIPSQPQIPSKACVQAFPAVEAGALVWLWMGAAERADEALVPDVAWHTDPAWKWVTGTSHVKANYRLLRENVLDLTHLPHVHTTSIGANDWTVPPKVSVGDAGHVTYHQAFPAAPQPAVYHRPIGVPADKPIERQAWGSSLSAACHQSRVELNDPAPAAGARSRWTLKVSHIVTPINPREFVYRWFLGWDIELPKPMLQAMRENVPRVYEEDKQILEAVQAMVERDPRGMNYPEVIVQADQAAIQFRRGLDAQLARERNP